VSQITKPQLPILRPNPGNLKLPVLRTNREKPSTLVLRPNQETHALVSLCMVQTSYDVTRPPNHLGTEYPTYVLPFSVLCSRSSTPSTILVTACHVAPVTYTSRDKQTRFSTRTDRGRITETSRIRIQTTASQWLITIKSRYWLLSFSHCNKLFSKIMPTQINIFNM
jgi:hypothetical protein